MLFGKTVGRYKTVYYGGVRMDNFTFGVTMLICGMGGTILTLWIMSLVMGLLGRMFPEVPAQKKED
jgi:hypothetical protein